MSTELGRFRREISKNCLKKSGSVAEPVDFLNTSAARPEQCNNQKKGVD
jgi:hypothetical protein